MTTPLTMPALEESGPFLQSAGLHFDEVTPSYVHGVIELTSEHHTPWGIVHGGVYATAVESAASVGASAAAAERGLIAVGVQNTTSFLRSMVEGRVEVVATPIQQGRTQQLWEVRITDDDGRLVVTGQLRLQNVEPRG